jgi:hypothetical protein
MLLAAIVLLLLSWGKSYPLHQESVNLPFISSIYWTYWVSYLLFAITFCWIALTTHSAPLKWGAAIGFFTLMNSLAYFYYFVPGSDTWFRNLMPAYLSGGFISSQGLGIYSWPGFFLLINMLTDITKLPMNLAVSLFYFITGFVIVSMVFFIATRHGFDGFWSVVIFSILGFFYLDYQFAAQTLALVFVMILLFVDYSYGKSLPGLVTVLTVVAAAAFTHAFMLVYYAFYVFIRAIRNRRYWIIGIFAITIAVISNSFLTFSAVSGLVIAAINSIQVIVGLSSYGAMVSTAVTNTSPFVTYARLTILAAAVVSGIGLIHLIRKRKALPQDIALTLAATLSLVVGAAIALIGTRAIQLAFVVAAIASGHFPELLHSRKFRGGLLLFLSISSVFCVLHFNYYSLLYQSQQDTQAATFLSDTMQLHKAASIRIFTPFIVRGFFGLSNNGNASIREFWSFYNVDPHSMDYVLAPTATPAILQYTGSTYVAAKSSLISTDNIIFNYGDGVIYAAT